MRPAPRFSRPLDDIGRIAIEPLVELDLFLPKWRYLVQEAVPKTRNSDWDTIEAVVENKRRRHYGHAASLVAVCLSLDSTPEKPSRGQELSAMSFADILPFNGNSNSL